MVELTYEQLVEAFGVEDVWRFDDGALSGPMTDAATRRFLTEVGFPLELRTGFVMAEEWEKDGILQTLPELYAEMGAEDRGAWTWPLPEGAGHWYALARFEGGTACLDGATGELWFIADWDEPPSRLHRGVDTFVYYMYILESKRDAYSYESVHSVAGDDPEERAAAYLAVTKVLVEMLHEADPTPFPQGIEEPWSDDFAGPWTVAFFDIAQGMWS